MMLKKIYALIVFVLVASYGCQMNVDEILTEDFIPKPETYVKADLRGIIQNQNGEAVQGAEVKIGNTTQTTNNWGYFSFVSVNLNADRAFVSITKDGYFNGSRSFVPLLKDNYIQVKLISKTLTATFNAGDGGTIELNDGAKVIFPQNAIKAGNEQVYNGMVNIYGHWINPTDADLGELMPANLVGVNSAEEELALAALGMMKIELESSNGNPLSLIDSAEVELKFPIPAEFQTNASAFMPTWFLENSGKIWNQGKQAILENDFYVAKFSQLSWLSCNWPYSMSNLDGKVENNSQENLGIENLKIRIRMVDRPWFSADFYTNEDGLFDNSIPAFNTMNIELLNMCNEVTYSNTIGPFSEDASLEPINTMELALNSTEIKGIFIDCDSNVIENGYAVVSFGEHYEIIETDNEGKIEAMIVNCDSINQISIIGVHQNTINPAALYSSEAAIDFGWMKICE